MISIGSFINKRVTNLSNISANIFEFSDINLVNSLTLPKKIISDKVFIAFLDDKVHHLILDTIVQYEYLKSIDPQIKILFFTSSHYKHSVFSEFIFNYYSEFNDPINLDEDNILISKAYFIFQEGTYKSILRSEFLKSIGINNPELFISDYHNSGINPYKALSLYPIQMYGMTNLVKNFEKIVSKASRKKIYISRKLANKRHKSGAEPESKLRYYDKEDIIEKYFVDQGYIPVILEKLSAQDQIKLMKDADEIAGCQGTGMLLTSFCKEDTKVFELQVTPPPNASYLDYNVNFNHKTFVINLISLTTEEDIWRSLDEQYKSCSI